MRKPNMYKDSLQALSLSQQVELERMASKNREYLNRKTEYQMNLLSENIKAELADIKRNTQTEKTYNKNPDAFWEDSNSYSKYNNDSEDDW